MVITGSRLIAWDDKGVTFRWKDYRQDGPARRKLMTLAPGEFIRRFLIHVLPSGFHRIRHYGLFANGARAANLAKARALLQPPASAPEAPPVAAATEAAAAEETARACPCCGGRMRLIETFERGSSPRTAPTRPAFRIDGS